MSRDLGWSSKKRRQYLGLAAGIAAYYLIHEGAHLVYACLLGAFKEIRFWGLGIQIEVYRERMSSQELGIFCLTGPLFSLAVGYLLTALSKKICSAKSNMFRVLLYYVTITLLLLDPLYLSLLYPFVGGGDMNGIRLLMPKSLVSLMFGLLFLANGAAVYKILLPRYQDACKSD
ncbi:MAG: hypothetical protein ACLSX5_14275 [Lachnospiraceae bacterium]